MSMESLEDITVVDKQHQSVEPCNRVAAGSDDYWEIPVLRGSGKLLTDDWDGLADAVGHDLIEQRDSR